MLYTHNEETGETDFGLMEELDVPDEFREPTDAELNDIQDNTEIDIHPDNFEDEL